MWQHHRGSRPLPLVAVWRRLPSSLLCVQWLHPVQVGLPEQSAIFLRLVSSMVLASVGAVTPGDNGEGPVVAVGGQGLPQPVTAASARRQVPVDSLVQGRVDLRSCVPRAWAVVRLGVPVSVQGVESCSRMWAGPLRCPPWHDSVSLVTPPKVSAGISPCPLKGRCIHSGELCAAHPAKVPGTRTMIRCFLRWCPQGGK